MKRGDKPGIDHDSLGEIADRNISLAVTSEDPRVVATCSRNVATMVGQVMEQEKRSGLSQQFRERLRKAEQEAEVARAMLAAMPGASTAAPPSPQVNVNVNFGEQFLERARVLDSVRRQLANDRAGLPVDPTQTPSEAAPIPSVNGT